MRGRETWTFHRIGQVAELEKGHPILVGGEGEPEVCDEGDFERDPFGELREEEFVCGLEHLGKLMAWYVTFLGVEVLHHGMGRSRRPVFVEFVDGRWRRRRRFRLAVLGSRLQCVEKVGKKGEFFRDSSLLELFFGRPWVLFCNRRWINLHITSSG